MAEIFCSKIEENEVIIGFDIDAETKISTATVILSNIVNPSPGGQTGEFNAYIDKDEAVPFGFSNVQLIANSFITCSGSFDGSEGSS